MTLKQYPILIIILLVLQPHLKAQSIQFVANQGQWDSSILFQATNSKTNTRVLKNEISFSEYVDKNQLALPFVERSFNVWNLRLKNADPNSLIYLEHPQDSRLSFIFGKNNGDQVIQPKQSNELMIANVYNNIDMVFHGIENDMKYDFILHQKSNINDIVLQYDGINKLSISKEGQLEISVGANKQIHQKPIAWQIINDDTIYVEVLYKIIDKVSFGFQIVSEFDKDYELIIDPLFQMVWSSYTKILGGANNINYCYSNAMDKEGNVYLTGMVDNSFPTTAGAYSGPGFVIPDIFVAKFSADGSTLLYGTYLPGIGIEHGVAIDVDSFGKAYVTGFIESSLSNPTNYATTTNAFQPTHGGNDDAFITVLNSAGSGLVYSSFLGGNLSEVGYDLIVESDGIVYITGYTNGGTFPIKNANTFPIGTKQLFVSKFDINQSGNNSLIYSVKIGSGAFTETSSRSIALDANGHAFITGTVLTGGTSSSFPISSGAYNNIYNIGNDGKSGFVIKLTNTLPVTIDYATYTGPSTPNGIAVDKKSNEAIITGQTFTSSYPTTLNSLQPMYSNGGDAFVTKLNATGNALVYSTFLGYDFIDKGTDIEVNDFGETYITGNTKDSFPTSNGAFQMTAKGFTEIFLVHLNKDGDGYACGGATLVGGSSDEYEGNFVDYPCPSLSLKKGNGITDTVAISATTHSNDFPTTVGAYEPTKLNGIHDQPVFFKMTCQSTNLPNALFTTQDTICVTDMLFLTNISTGSITSYSWSMQGSNIPFSNLQQPTGIFYMTAGTYSIVLIVCGDNGCDTFQKQVVVNALPIAQFDFIAPTIFTSNPIFQTTNISSGATSFQWYYKDSLISILANPSFAFQDTGMYCITLIALNSFGCADTFENCGNIMKPENYFAIVPSAFTPNGDNMNDEIGVLYKNIKIIKFAIFNRWGELVFETSDVSEKWNGNYKNRICELGTYYYYLSFTGNDGVKKILKGDISLIR